MSVPHRCEQILSLTGVTLLAILCSSGEAAGLVAYVGPGAGLGMIGALLAVLAIVVLGLLGPILYPIRLLMRRTRKQSQPESAAGESGEEPTATVEPPRD